LSDCKKRKHEVASGVGKSLTEPRDAEGLTGGSSDKKVNWFKIPLLKFGHVAKVRDMRIVMRQHGRRERLNVAKGNGLPSHVVPRYGRGFNARADGQVFHHSSGRRIAPMIPATAMTPKT